LLYGSFPSVHDRSFNCILPKPNQPFILLVSLIELHICGEANA